MKEPTEIEQWKARAENAARAHANCLHTLRAYEDALQRIASRSGGQCGLLLAHEMEQIAAEALLHAKP